jgi:hypothetical protein
MNTSEIWKRVGHRRWLDFSTENSLYARDIVDTEKRRDNNITYRAGKHVV